MSVEPSMGMRVVGIGLLVATASMPIVVAGSAPMQSTVVAVLGFCIGNRVQAAIDIR